jgi:hypothetical protein
MRGVEVALGEKVAHASDVGPRDLVLGGQHAVEVSRRYSNALTASPISMRRTRTASSTRASLRSPRQMCGDRNDRAEIPRVVVCRTGLQVHGVMYGILSHAARAESAGTRSTPASNSRSSSPHKAREGEHAGVGAQVDDQLEQTNL